MPQHPKLTTKLLIAALLCLCALAGASTSPPPALAVPLPNLPPQRPLPAGPPEIAGPPLPPLVLVSRLVLPEGVPADHPLLFVVRRMWEGAYGKQPAWRLPLLVNGLRNAPRSVHLTAFSSRCADGGGPYTRWGTRVRTGICAADPEYWGPGSVVWIGSPVEAMLIVEDTGGAVHGRDRFDVSLGDDAEACSAFGVRMGTYVPLYVAPTRRDWGSKPAGWHPPILPLEQELVAVPAGDARAMVAGVRPAQIAKATGAR